VTVGHPQQAFHQIRTDPAVCREAFAVDNCENLAIGDFENGEDVAPAISCGRSDLDFVTSVLKQFRDKVFELARFEFVQLVRLFCETVDGFCANGANNHANLSIDNGLSRLKKFQPIGGNLDLYRALKQGDAQDDATRTFHLDNHALYASEGTVG
jgi:hypothetical protein